MGIFDKRIMNFLVIIFLSVVSFFWTEYVFEISAGLLPLGVIIVVRMLCSLFIYKDYSLSWSKVSNTTILIRSTVYGTAFVICSVLLHQFVAVLFLVSDMITYLLLINLATYIYNYIINRSNLVKIYTVVIYGAGKAGVKLSEEFRHSEYRIKCFIDDDEMLQKRTIDGIRIVSSQSAIKRIKKGYRVDLLVLAIPSASKDRINEIYNNLSPYVENIKILPSLDEILTNMDYSKQLKSISVEDLLTRNQKDLDKISIREFIAGKTVMITGGGGSIGSEIARQCLKYGAEKLILLDHSEFNLYTITEELKDGCIIPVLASVTDRVKMDTVFEQYAPDIVVHAAAYKHVPLCEANVEAAIFNNIVGTKNVADLCVEHKSGKMILISTDKAIRPTNVMGATKRVCELYAQNLRSQDTDIISVRFGNVLGSSGSVIPKFKAQLQRGGPITVTHPEITRYFMLIPEACELVLQAGAIGKCGETFILDMGKPIRIVDLAHNMIRLSGMKNVEIKFTGLRPGEKLYEEILVSDADVKTRFESILVAKHTGYSIETLNRDIEELLAADNKVERLKMILPEEFKDLRI